MTQFKTEAVFLFPLSWMQAQALKWQPVTTKARGLAFTSLFQLAFSPWSYPRHLNTSSSHAYYQCFCQTRPE